GRDRSATYAGAAAQGAPGAVQVADRWHLLTNLREAVEGVLGRHSTVVNATLKALEAPPCPPHEPTGPQTGAAVPSGEPPSPRPSVEPVPVSPRLQAKRAKRRGPGERVERGHELHQRGHPAPRSAPEPGPAPPGPRPSSPARAR